MKHERLAATLDSLAADARDAWIMRQMAYEQAAYNYWGFRLLRHAQMEPAPDSGEVLAKRLEEHGRRISPVVASVTTDNWPSLL